VSGVYPALGISEARTEARSLHTHVKHGGVDPIADRRHDRAIGAAAKAGEGTLAALLDLYADKRGVELKRWDEAKRSIEVVFKPLLPRPLGTLVARDFQMLADRYKAQHSAGAAVRYVRPILGWAAKRGYLAPEVASIHLPAPVRRRKRVLSSDELVALLHRAPRVSTPLRRSVAVHAVDANPPTRNRHGPLAGGQPGGAYVDHHRDQEW
jgi:hypothetical protein